MPTTSRSLEPALETFYAAEIARTPPRAITAHLHTLRTLAESCDVAVEFGVKSGASSSALLMGARYVTSYDIRSNRQARHLARAVAPRWNYVIASSLLVDIPACDLLFIDSLHTFAQCDGELRRHAHRVRRYLVFHDTVTFGSVGADGETGRHLWTYEVGREMPTSAWGIRPAIDALMIRDATWQIASHDCHSHGLLVLKRG